MSPSPTSCLADPERAGTNVMVDYNQRPDNTMSDTQSTARIFPIVGDVSLPASKQFYELQVILATPKTSFFYDRLQIIQGEHLSLFFFLPYAVTLTMFDGKKRRD